MVRGTELGSREGVAVLDGVLLDSDAGRVGVGARGWGEEVRGGAGSGEGKGGVCCVLYEALLQRGEESCWCDVVGGEDLRGGLGGVGGVEDGGDEREGG